MMQAAGKPKRRRSAARRFLWVGFLVLDGLLLVLFAAGYAARYIPPRHLWWTELIAVGLPYLSLLLVPAALLAARAGLWRLMVLHLFLLLLAGIRFGSSDLLRPRPEPRSADLTLMTFNVPLWWGYHMDQKVQKMLELVREVRPDLITLQEAFIGYRSDRSKVRGARYLTALVDSLGYYFQGVQTAEYEDGITPLPVLTRFPHKEQHQTVFQMEPSDNHGMRIVRARFTWEGREAVLYNLHLRTFGHDKPWQAEQIDPFDPGFWIPYLQQYRESYRIRAWEVEQIRAMLEQETRPFILCGDLNSTAHNWAYRRLAEGFGLQDAFKVAGRGWGATYHTRLPFVRIDFVLVSPEWEVVSARVKDTWLSDHRPLVVNLRWKNPPAQAHLP